MPTPTFTRLASTRTFGVEIEFNGISYNTALAAIGNVVPTNGVYWTPNARRSYSPGAPSWSLTTDGSVSGTGLEVVSPILSGSDGLQQTKAVLDALVAAGAKVDRSCGIHVHVGANDLGFEGLQNTLAWFVRAEPVIDRVMAPSRRDGGAHYVQPMKALDYTNGSKGVFDRINAANNVSELRSIWRTRYVKVNFQSYAIHGTIEFRQHGGSLDAEKVCNWVKFLVARVDRTPIRVRWADYSANADAAVRGFNRVFSRIGRAGVTFFRNRATGFGFEIA